MVFRDDRTACSHPCSRPRNQSRPSLPEYCQALTALAEQSDFIMLKKGNTVKVIPETAPGKDFSATIDFIEPFYRKDSKTLTARVYFNNSELKIPIGSQVKATIFGNSRNAYWLPKSSILSMGMDKVVFQKTGSGFKAQNVNTGILYKDQIQIMNGLSPLDSVAVNAQYLMDSESFIKIGK